MYIYHPHDKHDIVTIWKREVLIKDDKQSATHSFSKALSPKKDPFLKTLILFWLRILKRKDHSIVRNIPLRIN